MKFLPTDILAIAGSIIKAWPYSECGMPNSFAIVSERRDLEHNMLGKTYADYENGEFWARDWVASGADPDTMCVEFGLLAIELGKPIRESIYSDKVCYPIYFMFIDKPDCETCPQSSSRHGTKLEEMLNMWVMMFMNEIRRFRKYKILLDVNGAEVEQMAWATPELIECWKEEGSIIDCEESCLAELEVMIEEPKGGYAIASIPVGIRQGAIGCIMSMTVCDCLVPDEENTFNYKTTKQPRKLARTTCVTCD